LSFEIWCLLFENFTMRNTKEPKSNNGIRDKFRDARINNQILKLEGQYAYNMLGGARLYSCIG